MKRLHLSICSALVCLFARTSYAMPVVSSSGVTGLEVNGTLYDITIGEVMKSHDIVAHVSQSSESFANVNQSKVARICTGSEV